MSNMFQDFINSFAQNTTSLFLGFLLFGSLSRVMPCNKSQPLLTKGIFVDLGYYFIVPLFTRIVENFYLAIGAALLFHGESNESIKHYFMYGYGPLGQLPLWLQAAITFILSDIILYWIHRGFHGRRMWDFHAIHHSSKVVDWHSTYRFHPVNVWLSFVFVDSIMIFLGLSVQSILLFSTFNMLYSGMVHANLNWTFGPFKYLFASPVFHRWHHTKPNEGGNKNFAPTFPLLDIMFGTFYMPEGKFPEDYGVEGEFPDSSFLKQIIWPIEHQV